MKPLGLAIKAAQHGESLVDVSIKTSTLGQSSIGNEGRFLFIIHVFEVF